MALCGKLPLEILLFGWSRNEYSGKGPFSSFERNSSHFSIFSPPSAGRGNLLRNKESPHSFGRDSARNRDRVARSPSGVDEIWRSNDPGRKPDSPSAEYRTGLCGKGNPATDHPKALRWEFNGPAGTLAFEEIFFF